MADNQSSNDTGSVSFGSVEISLPRVARFWILLLFDIPSTICAFFVFFCILIDHKLRSAIKNHILIILLIFGLASQLIDVPFYLNFIIHSGVVPAQHWTCLLWWFVDIGMYNGGAMLMLLVALERHIIIFHDQWLLTRKRRIFVHYIPLLFILLYIFIFYIYNIYYFPCENAYDYTLPYCSTYPCYLNDPFMGEWDWIVNTAVPSFFEPVFSLAFVFRVIWHKYHAQLPIQWRKQRKMAIQLMSLSFLNLISNFPLSIIGIAHAIGMPQDVGVNAEHYFFFLCYLVIFFFPFICLASISSVYKKFQAKILRRQRRRQIHAFTMWARPGEFRMNMTIQQ
ncbi:unnamed protein product [Rotaria magnacalcarata]|uniref:G-protein coupled receptors family 1 profile domain-containing protein n=1 Tax=Rotaria magnacalcarata TaxID=392030 RepID=A0A816R7S7_9BILA|nr:unnamed protein product [Rotaria magnacalcarata]CAF1407769.1 unnamed protein product [Rotaria magnacalcarata]CAF2003833.1 unnamed protein product [Rotaria magnacalcarata]CAF2068785.1 unnamed protein product [Rotaria magnacalcarata]CAF2073227.1 unnamed protein product [Rotaria magnacalcarata]